MSVIFDSFGGTRVAERKVFGHVCQLVDSLPYKEEVRGSSPFVPTRSQVKSKKSKGKTEWFLF